MDSCKVRRALEAASGGSGQSGAVGTATMQEKEGGFAGRRVQRACCPSWGQGDRRHTGEVGVEMKEVTGQGKVLVCPHPPPISSWVCIESFKCS